VAVIGDSFVFGSGVVQGDVFTSRLSTSDRPFNVWNFGVPGTGPFNALYLWRDYVRQIRPQVVVVTVYAGNDAGDALRESKEAKPRLVIVARAKMLWHRLRAPSHTGALPRSRAAGAHGWNAFRNRQSSATDALSRRRSAAFRRFCARTAGADSGFARAGRADVLRSNPFNIAEAVLDPDGLRHNLPSIRPR
jgi:hypothetical protein